MDYCCDKFNDVFTARLAQSFESQPKGERLYEVVTPEGERIGSTTSEQDAQTLALSLNKCCRIWANTHGAEAVLA